MEEIRNLGNRILRKVRIILKSIERSVSGNWIAYNLVVVLLGVFLIPTLFHVEKGFVLVVTIIIYVFLALFDYVKFNVGEEDPKTFLKAERLKNAIFRLFWVLLFVLIGFICVLAISTMIPIQELLSRFIGDAFLLIVLLYVGTWLYSITLYAGDIARSKALLKLQARTRFRIMLDALSNKNQKEIAKSVPLFREGVELSNRFLRKRFDFVIRKQVRFYGYVKLMTCIPNDEITKEIQKGVGKVADELKKEESDPFEIIKGLKETISEPISNRKDMIAEVEIEPRLRKWFLANLPIIVAIVEIISLLIVIFGFVMGRWPI